MHLMTLLCQFVLVMVLMPIMLCDSVEAAIIHLKSGEKIEGVFVDADKDQIRIKIGSQTITFSLDEISAIVFDDQSYVDKQSTSFESSSKEALQILRGLESIAEAGITYGDYSPRVSDAKISISQFLEDYEDGPNQELRHHLKYALEYYVTASNAWNSDISNSGYSKLATDPYVNQCTNLLEEVNNHLSPSITDLSARGLTIAMYGVPHLWECARSHIDSAKTFIGK